MVRVINLLSPSMKWTGSMLCKQRLTADQRISQKGVKIKVSTILAIIFCNIDCMYVLQRQSELEISAC